MSLTTKGITVECFRPNLVVDGVPAFAEDAWAGVKVGSVQLRHAGPCSRCSMVNIDARAGTMNGQALMLLAQFRMHGVRDAKVLFPPRARADVSMASRTCFSASILQERMLSFDCCVKAIRWMYAASVLPRRQRDDELPRRRPVATVK